MTNHENVGKKMSKYEDPELPVTKARTLELAEQYEGFARQAREADRHGSAREFAFTALLLRAHAERMP